MRGSEVEMPDCWKETGEGARLSCQVPVVEGMAGMELWLPESQN